MPFTFSFNCMRENSKNELLTGRPCLEGIYPVAANPQPATAEQKRQEDQQLGAWRASKKVQKADILNGVRAVITKTLIGVRAT